MRTPFTETLALVSRTATGEDDDGNDRTSQSVRVVMGLFAPGGSVESTNEQQRVTDQPAAYFPFGTDVKAIDAVVTDPVVDDNGSLTAGTWYEVDADAASWQNPYSRRQYGVAVPLRRVTG